MGRESRQARRARERRELEQRKRQHQGNTAKWSIAFVAGVVVLAILIFGGMALANNKGSSNANAIPTASPGRTIDGIACNPNGETTVYHEHGHLNLIDHGKPISLSSDFGHNYNHDCLYWLHVHPGTPNVIHVEAPQTVKPTLKTVFDVWGQTLTASQIGSVKVKPGDTVRTWVNQKPYTGNISSIKIVRHTDITIEVGPPFSPPKKFNFAQYQL